MVRTRKDPYSQHWLREILHYRGARISKETVVRGGDF